MKYRFAVIITSLLFCCMFTARAQLIRVNNALDRDSIMIGDQVTYSIRVDAAPDVEFLVPPLIDTLTRVLEVLFPISSDTLLENGRRIVDQRYMVTGFESGTERIPPQMVFFRAGDRLDTALSLPLELRIYEPVVDTAQQIKPIKPPINTPLTFREALPWMGVGFGGLALITMAVLLIRRYRKYRRDPEAFALKTREPAHVIAFRELDHLKEQKLWERGEVKQYYSTLTRITRQYIERQYGIPAMERTTGEILHAFRRVNPDDSMLDEMLEGLLLLSDLVKFAREDPLPLDNQTNLNNAYLFVQKTYPFFFQEEPGRKKEETSHGGN